MTYIIVIIYSVFFIASIFFLNFYSLRSCIACMRTHIQWTKKKTTTTKQNGKKLRNKDKKKQRKHKMDFSWNWKIDSPSKVLMASTKEIHRVYVCTILLHLVLNTNYVLSNKIWKKVLDRWDFECRKKARRDVKQLRCAKFDELFLKLSNLIAMGKDFFLNFKNEATSFKRIKTLKG